MSTTTTTTNTTTTAVIGTIAANVPEPEFIPKGDAVADLHFFSPSADGEAPFNYIGTPPPNKPQNNFSIDTHPVKIHDLRGNESSLSLDKEAFALHSIPTALSYADYEDDAKIESTYYPEIIDIVKRYVSDTNEIIIFDHTVRRSTVGSLRTPVNRVHIDQTARSGGTRLVKHVSEERVAEVLAKGIRHQIINVWRPINGPVMSSPLAFADSSTVLEEDLIGVAHIYPNYRGETSGVKYNSGQKWWYVSGQTNDEVTLIKCFDSEIGENGERRRVPHSAFIHPGTPEGARGRESIEVRCFIVG